MKLGVNILNFGPGASPDGLRGWARFAEQAGFAIAMISDHVALTPDVDANYPAPFYDPFATLAWLAGETNHIELGTTVAVLPYRNPLFTARLASNIDQFSGGRFVLGVGVGGYRREYAALGVPFERRGAIADEYLAAIKQLWTSDVASMSGEFVSFDEVRTGPRPVRRPHPPIWVGGASEVAIRRTVQFADAWHPLYPRLAWLRDTGLPSMRRVAAATGRQMPALCPRIYLQLSSREVNDPERQLGTGSLAQVLGDLDELDRLGAAYVLLDTYAGHPEDRRPPSEDWGTLETVASHCHQAR